MARDEKATALGRLLVAKANLDAAREAKAKTRDHLDKAIIQAVEAGISKAEIARLLEMSPQRISQITVVGV